MNADDYMSGNDCRTDQGQGSAERDDLGQNGYDYQPRTQRTWGLEGSTTQAVCAIVSLAAALGTLIILGLLLVVLHP